MSHPITEDQARLIGAALKLKFESMPGTRVIHSGFDDGTTDAFWANVAVDAVCLFDGTFDIEAWFHPPKGVGAAT